MCFIFLKNFCSKHLSLRYARDTRLKAYRGLHCPLFLSDFNQYWTVVTNLSENYQKSNFLTVRTSVCLSWYMRTHMVQETDPFCNFKLRTFQNYYIVIRCNFLFQPPLAWHLWSIRTPSYLAVGLRAVVAVVTGSV